jgi:hypothetical protein
MLVEGHAYTVLSVTRDGDGNPASVTIRNPWGYDGGSQASGDSRDGWITLSWNDFKDQMQGIWFN